MRIKTLAERLMTHVEFIPIAGCWVWTGALDGKGYGYLAPGTIERRAHRASWHTFRGPIPAGMFVCHQCDVRCCINPSHLYLGTYMDNYLDAEAKGRLFRWGHEESSK